MRSATAILDGRIPVFGHGLLDVGNPPRWHREPLAGIDAPRDHWSRIRYLDRAVVGDHKVLWEFNRHQYFVTLAQAWAYTGDARWVECWQHHLGSWIDENPPKCGVHWASSLEVAYRAISWCLAFRMFEAAGISPQFRERVMASLTVHAAHVERYLSYYFSPNTHLTGEALGLMYVGTLFPQLPSATRWRDTATTILDAEINRQIHRDGVYFEQATQYQRYTTEIYLHYRLLREAAGLPRSAAVDAALHGLFDVLLAITRPDGTMPLIGDDDGGRLVQLDDERPDELRGLLRAGAFVLDRDDLAVAGAGGEAYCCWLLGPDAAERVVKVPPLRSTGSRAFSRGGVFVIREAASDGGGHAVIDGGPHGALSCGHSHADALSVELWAAGRPLLIDPGTYSYSGPERDAFRATAAHNTLEIDGVGSSTPAASPFKWRSRADTVVTGWRAQGESAWFSGFHDGYQTLSEPARHCRDVLHPSDGVWIVHDRIESTGAHHAALRWNVGLGVTTHVVDAWELGARVDLRVGDATLATLLIGGATGEVSLVPIVISRQYGASEDSIAIVWRSRAQVDVRLWSVLVDWTATAPRSISITGIRTGDEPYQVAYHAHSPTVVGARIHLERPISTGDGGVVDARMSWSSEGSDGRDPEIIAAGVRRFVHAGNEMSFANADGWLKATEHRDGWSLDSGRLQAPEI